MTDFINNYLTPIYEDFLLSESLYNLCDLKSFYFNGTVVPDYTKPLIQQYYLLKFAPAYIWEYKKLYGYAYLNNRFHKIFSFGCGAGLDLAGQYLSRGSGLSYVDYKGIDIVDWSYKTFPPSTNIHYINNDIKVLTQNDLYDRNILFFPKSLSEFPQDKFVYLLNLICNTDFTEDEICLIISSTDSKDTSRFESIVHSFLARGYSYKLLSEYEGMKEWVNHSYSKGIKAIDCNFDFPDEILNHLGSLTNSCTRNNCPDSTCNIDIRPVLTTNHMVFAYTVLEKQK